MAKRTASERLANSSLSRVKRLKWTAERLMKNCKRMKWTAEQLLETCERMKWTAERLLENCERMKRTSERLRTAGAERLLGHGKRDANLKTFQGACPKNQRKYRKWKNRKFHSAINLIRCQTLSIRSGSKHWICIQLNTTLHAFLFSATKWKRSIKILFTLKIWSKVIP